MSTLPRTRSLGRADASSLHTLKRPDQNRPSSLCESSWTRINLNATDSQLEHLRRTPSQANHLCTTVPTSLVSRNLGGRHAPTKSSLRHSRMVVAKKGTNGIVRRRRLTPRRDFGRIRLLVMVGQILVGIMAIILSIWLLLWTPFLKFREIPHYSGISVFLSGIFGVFYLSCAFKRKKKYLLKIFKAIVIALCGLSVITCLSVCIFSAFHLIQLAPMECSQKNNNIAIRPIYPVASPNSLLQSSPPKRSENHLTEHEPQKYEEHDAEGNGFESSQVVKDSETDPKNDFANTHHVKWNEMEKEERKMNATYCLCEKRYYMGQRVAFSYPQLNCLEVKNVLPVLFVATCIISTVGAIFSVIILYILWMTREMVYKSSKASELKRFISKNKKTPINSQNEILLNGTSLNR